MKIIYQPVTGTAVCDAIPWRNAPAFGVRVKALTTSGVINPWAPIFFLTVTCTTGINRYRRKW